MKRLHRANDFVVAAGTSNSGDLVPSALRPGMVERPSIVVNDDGDVIRAIDGKPPDRGRLDAPPATP
jgi:hypothetical protein